MISDVLFLTCQNIFFQVVAYVNMVEWTKYDCFSTISEKAKEVKRLSGDLPLAGQGNW